MMKRDRLRKTPKTHEVAFLEHLTFSPMWNVQEFLEESWTPRSQSHTSQAFEGAADDLPFECLGIVRVDNICFITGIQVLQYVVIML